MKFPNISNSIKARRGSMTYREAEAESGISAATLLRIEVGQIPTLETLLKIVAWTGKDLDYLLLDKTP